jgi:hypothetical protein
MQLNAYLFYLLHLAQAVGKHFGYVESRHIPADKTQPGDIFIIDACFAAYFEDFWTVD